MRPEKRRQQKCALLPCSLFLSLLSAVQVTYNNTMRLTSQVVSIVNKCLNLSFQISKINVFTHMSFFFHIIPNLTQNHTMQRPNS